MRLHRAAFVSLAVLLLPRLAEARETAGVDDETPEADALEDEVLGPRGNLRTRAETVSFDAKLRTLELAGDVRVDAPPFHLRSERIRLTRTNLGIEVEGKGRLAFCPCLGTPLTVEFDKAIVAPPGDLVLKSPKLELYGVPVFYLPWFWLRSDEKPGALPPDIAYRGRDGFFAGGGVHLPWKRYGLKHALDLRAGAYLFRGVALDARLRSPVGTTKVRYDRLAGGTAPELLGPAGRGPADDGLAVDARGGMTKDGLTTAWDVDVLRGRRGVGATTDLDAAAKPWDRASGDAALRFGPFVASSGVRAVSRRGGGLETIESAGPVVALRASEALGGHIVYDATVEGGSLRLSGLAASTLATQPPAIVPDALSFARGEAGLLAATSAGPVALSLTTRGATSLAREGRRDGADRAGTVRARVALPLARAFASSDEDASERNDPLVHVIEPFTEAAVLATKSDGVLGTLPGRGLATLDGTAPLAHAGLKTTLGRWGRREALELVASGGGAFGSNEVTVRPLARGRVGASFLWLGAAVETGHVIAYESEVPGRGGSAVVARLRIGRADGPRVLGNVATRDGIDPVLARAITEAPLEAPAGFLSREGTTGGASLVVPWTKSVTTSVGADGDATAQELVAARGGVELRDRCGCVTLRANGAHRIGRDGVDVWLAIDFAADR